jgi:tripartite-type tricarboxylate transporter receptor subunit TctC
MIPYKSSGESVQAVLGGQVMMTIVDPPPATGALKAGTLRGLAVTSGKRHPSWPDLPTMAEAGVPDMEVPVWTAFFAPAKTPPAVIERLYRAVAVALAKETVRSNLARQGLPVALRTPAEIAAMLPGEVAKWAAVIKTANVTVE